MSPRVEIYSLCCLPIELPSFAHISISVSFASIYSRYMSYSPLKNIAWEIGIARLQ